MVWLCVGICQYGTILLASVAWQSSQTAAYLQCTGLKLLEGVQSVEFSSFAAWCLHCSFASVEVAAC